MVVRKAARNKELEREEGEEVKRRGEREISERYGEILTEQEV